MVAKFAFLLLAVCALAYPASANLYRHVEDSQELNGQVPSVGQSQSSSETGVPQNPLGANNPVQSEQSTSTESASTTTEYSSSTTPYPSQVPSKQWPSNQRPSGVPQKLDEAGVVRLLLNTLKSEERELNKASDTASQFSKGALRQARQLVRAQEKAVRDFAKSAALPVDQNQGGWNSQRNQLESANVVGLLVKLAKQNRSTVNQSGKLNKFNDFFNQKSGKSKDPRRREFPPRFPNSQEQDQQLFKQNE